MKSLAITLILLTSWPAMAQVNRCVNPATGKVTFTDGPCDPSQQGSQVMAPRSRESIELERERAQLARERQLLQQERDLMSRQREASPPREATPAPAPAESRADSYACQVARRNLGVGISPESRMRSQRDYEIACFGDRAADVEQSRAGRPVYAPSTNITIGR